MGFDYDSKFLSVKTMDIASSEIEEKKIFEEQGLPMEIALTIFSMLGPKEWEATVSLNSAWKQVTISEAKRQEANKLKKVIDFALSELAPDEKYKNIVENIKEIHTEPVLESINLFSLKSSLESTRKSIVGILTNLDEKCLNTLEEKAQDKELFTLAKLNKLLYQTADRGDIDGLNELLTQNPHNEIDAEMIISYAFSKKYPTHSYGPPSVAQRGLYVNGHFERHLEHVLKHVKEAPLRVMNSVFIQHHEILREMIKPTIIEKIVKLIHKVPYEHQQLCFSDVTDLLCSHGIYGCLASARANIVPLLPVEVRDPYLAAIGRRYLEANKIEQAEVTANEIENIEIKTKLQEEIKGRARSSFLSVLTSFFRR